MCQRGRHSRRRESILSLLEGLTPAQRAAVEHVDGPLLILAGPGSGKTRVVTRRIANLVQQGIPPRQILAITFTNRAADEMRERVEQLLPESHVWVSTFHRLCVRLLRQYGNVVGLDSNFSILDTGDQKLLVRQVLSELDFDPVHFAPDKILWRISNAKNDCITPEMYQRKLEETIGDHMQMVTGKVFERYQQRLLEANSVDFDDLLIHTVTLLSENPELRATLDARHRYVLVDEYQDTNLAQYKIVAALSQQHPNLCVTGDPDQSIYGWRGARIGNIFAFRRDYPEHVVIPLEQNFRSTQSILQVADQLIGHNQKRMAKRLVTENPDGDPPQLLICPDSHQEADAVARQLRDLVETGEYRWSDCAVFYRVNALSRSLEAAFLRQRIPFQVATGVAFYERAEVKDLLAYLRLVHNPSDRSAFLRVVNSPLRGLGKTSQNRLVEWADREGLTLLEACERAKEIPKLSKAAQVKFPVFARMMGELSLAASGSVGELLSSILDRTRFLQQWEAGGSEQDGDKIANVEELVGAARSYDEHAADEISLEGFLEQVALVSDVDSIDRTTGEVTLMTMHAAKGLEFPVVVILGLEEGLIPHERSLREQNRDELEEERRLLFVGMTRAKRRLFLTQSRMRSIHGRTMPTIASPFLNEFPIERVHCDGDEWEFAQPWLEQAEASPPPQEPQLATLLPGDLMSKLKTGADLANGVTQGKVELQSGYAIGMQVRHPRYGIGTVVNLQGMGLNRTVTVRFVDGDRVQDFVSKHAPLQPIGVG
ncbi:MAG: UvrD-helicase domain-containing protein [Planctomycetaceae bacterium]|nr:UvrD-helicase domain-containing protein [Planctomycetaceae bacterium]